jgi:1,4-alpha-glucan branching enzyme
LPDPENPFSVGSGNYINSVVTVKPSHTFVLENYSDAREVIVTGTFSNWNPSMYRMIRRDGKWIFPVHLHPGKVLYKFVVDGRWMLDPANELWEENEWGTGNSLLWVSR